MPTACRNTALIVSKSRRRQFYSKWRRQTAKFSRHHPSRLPLVEVSSLASSFAAARGAGAVARTWGLMREAESAAAAAWGRRQRARRSPLAGGDGQCGRAWQSRGGAQGGRGVERGGRGSVGAASRVVLSGGGGGGGGCRPCGRRQGLPAAASQVVPLDSWAGPLVARERGRWAGQPA